MVNNGRRILLLGSVFLIFLALSYIENTLFLKILDSLLKNQFLAVAMIFTHNIIVISLIVLGLTFYVDLMALDSFKREKHGRIVLEHPRTFAIVFTFVILFLSLLKGTKLFYGGISIELLPLILLGSSPIGIIEGYGIYLTVKNTLSRISMKGLVHIYVVFLIAAIIEVTIINLLA